MLESIGLSRIEEIIIDALDLGVYDNKNYRIDGDITYVSIKYNDLSIAVAFRNKKSVVVKVSLIEDNVKLPIFGGREANPASREWITNERKLRKKTLKIINEIKTEINLIKHHNDFMIQKAV